MLTTADNYSIIIPKELDWKEKSLIICSLLLIDFTFFESSGGGSGMYGGYGYRGYGGYGGYGSYGYGMTGRSMGLGYGTGIGSYGSGLYY